MSLNEFIKALLSYMAVIPAAAICFFPMKDQMKYSVGKMLKYLMITFCISLPALSFLTCYFKAKPNTFLSLLLITFFFCYHKSLNVHISKSISIYSYVCVLMALLSNFSNGFDAVLHPYSGADTFSMAGSVFQLALSSIFALLLARPFSKYGSLLINRLNLPKAWKTTVLLSGLFFFVNILIRPLHYQTLYTNNVFLAFWGILTMMLVTLLLLTVIFYFIISGIIKEMETAERNRFLSMQESQYIKQQHYMEATEEERHNFRQTIRTLENLARKGDNAAIRKYLSDYISTMPKNDIISFCKNHAVNALLNYYAESAENLKIYLNWQVELLENLSIPDTDLCSIIGNLLENAVASCEKVPEADRFIFLSVTTTEGGAYLCIVMTNPFSGNLKKSGERYLSTKKHGTGIGLASIQSIAEQHGGIAKFTDRNGEFYSDVMLLLDSASLF